MILYIAIRIVLFFCFTLVFAIFNYAYNNGYCSKPQKIKPVKIENIKFKDIKYIPYKKFIKKNKKKFNINTNKPMLLCITFDITEKNLLIKYGFASLYKKYFNNIWSKDTIPLEPPYKRKSSWLVNNKDLYLAVLLSVINNYSNIQIFRLADTRIDLLNDSSAYAKSIQLFVEHYLMALYANLFYQKMHISEKFQSYEIDAILNTKTSLPYIKEVILKFQHDSWGENKSENSHINIIKSFIHKL